MKSIVGLLAKFTIMQAPGQGVIIIVGSYSDHWHWVGCFWGWLWSWIFQAIQFSSNIIKLDYVKVYVATLCRVLEEISEVLNEKQAVTSKELEELQYLDQIHSFIVNLSWEWAEILYVLSFLSYVSLFFNTSKVFMESLRLYPPISAFTKQAPKGLKLSNSEVPEGTMVAVRTCNCSIISLHVMFLGNWMSAQVTNFSGVGVFTIVLSFTWILWGTSGIWP